MVSKSEYTSEESQDLHICIIYRLIPYHQIVGRLAPLWYL